MNITKITQNGIISNDIYSDEFSRRKIYLTGEINDAKATDICVQINCLAENSSEDIYLIIQSPGGNVSAGMAILDTMNSCGCDICTVVQGMAASMGALLASSGTNGKRYVSENSEIMIHQPIGGASGQASDIERQASHILKIKKRLHNILARNTGKALTQINKDCDRDFWMDAREAVKYGLADKIFEGFKK